MRKFEKGRYYMDDKTKRIERTYEAQIEKPTWKEKREQKARIDQKKVELIKQHLYLINHDNHIDDTKFNTLLKAYDLLKDVADRQGGTVKLYYDPQNASNYIFYCVPDCLIMKGWNANDNMQQVFNMVDNIVMFPYKHHQMLLRFHMDIFRINEERD